jgi:hypothetical protein
VPYSGLTSTHTVHHRRWGFLRILRRDPNAPVSVASSVLVFAVSGLAALALIAGGVVYSTRNTATQEAIDDSIRLTEVVSRGLVEPVLDEEILAGDEDALQRLDDVVKNQVIGESVVRVKVWSRDCRRCPALPSRNPSRNGCRGPSGRRSLRLPALAGK